VEEVWGGGLVLVLVPVPFPREDKHKAPTRPLRRPLSLQKTGYTYTPYLSYTSLLIILSRFIIFSL